MIERSLIQVTEGLVTEPVSLDEAKDWIGGLEGVTDFDEMITSMIKSSRVQIEKETSLALVAKTVTLDCVNTSAFNESVLLPYALQVSGVTVKSLDSSFQETTLTVGTDYFLRGNTVVVGQGRFSIAYTIVPVVNQDLKEIIKMDVAEKFKNRGDTISEVAKQRAQAHAIPWL
jgi:hypothetical protein